jgi:extradiol dioxygenase family protein
MPHWSGAGPARQAMANRLTAANIDFLLEPQIRF